MESVQMIKLETIDRLTNKVEKVRETLEELKVETDEFQIEAKIHLLSQISKDVSERLGGSLIWA